MHMHIYKFEISGLGCEWRFRGVALSLDLKADIGLDSIVCWVWKRVPEEYIRWEEAEVFVVIHPFCDLPKSLRANIAPNETYIGPSGAFLAVCLCHAWELQSCISDWFQLAQCVCVVPWVFLPAGRHAWCCICFKKLIPQFASHYSEAWRSVFVWYYIYIYHSIYSFKRHACTFRTTQYKARMK